MWLVILGLVFIAFCTSFILLCEKFRRLSIGKKLIGESKVKKTLLPIAFWFLVGLFFTLVMTLMNAIIIILHILLFWLILDLISFIIKKCAKKEIKSETRAVWAVVICAIYLSFGWYFAHHVDVTTYEIKTDKEVGKLHVVMFSDSHLGSTFSGEKFGTYVDQMNAENPDVVLIVGDYTDDGSPREDVIAATKHLGRLKTKYGVYFVYGNHDKGFSSEERRGWKNAELVEWLNDSGVTILEDQSVLVDDRFYIVGRQDYSEIQRDNGREEIKYLVQDLDKDKFTIVLDHQPNDYEKEANVGCDLVLSGHTHGGQMIPINYVGVLAGINDATYGYEKRSATDFLVSSGISCWDIKFKTGCKSEYVVIDIAGK